MADALIKLVNRSPLVRDALKQPEKERQAQPRGAKKRSVKNDSKRIIDTFA